MAAQKPDKWTPFIDGIEQAPGLPEKFNLLAAMVRLMATNDLSCLEDRIDGLSAKFDKCMKKIYIVGIIIAVMVFTGVNITTVFEFILKIAK